MSSHLIRSDLVPMVAGYLLLMGALAAGLWALVRRTKAGRPNTRATGKRDAGWSALIVHVLADAAGGYVLLLTIVVLYYYGVARVGSNFLESAFSGSGLLLVITLPMFLAASWLTRRRKRQQPAEPGAAGPGVPGQGGHSLGDR